MKNIKTLIIIIALISFTLTSCKKDKESPVITITSPAAHAEFHEGDTIHVDGVFTDDMDLASYSVEVGDESGGHIHEFHHSDAGNISGKSYNYHSMVTVPDSLSISMFYLHFSVSDAEGNTATSKVMLHIH